MKKNNTAEKTILDAEKLTKALKEGTEKSLRDIMNETLSKLVMESDDDDEENVEDDSYDVEDVDTEEIPVSDEVPATEDEPEVEGGEEGSEEDDADDEWSDMEEYKVGDNDYDFTGVDGEMALKVYNKLGDDDQIFVKKEDDGSYSVKDDETGAEFVIELDPEALAAENDEESEEDFADSDVEDDFGSEEPGDEMGIDSDSDVDSDQELEIDLGDDDEDELNEENLGYTDSYQKNVFDKKFGMNEPANSKATYSMDAGAPKGEEKPWAGKGDGKPFGKDINEEVDEFMDANVNVSDNDVDGLPPMGEDANLEEGGSGQNTKRKMVKHMNQINTGAHNQRVASDHGEYVGLKTDVNENVQKIVKWARAIQAENKQYAGYVDRIKKSVCEQAVLNANLIRLVELLVNESATKEEKKSMLERFNNVKTLAEGKELQEKIKAELNEARKFASPIVEKQFVANSTNTLNENVIYQNRQDVPALDLMDRMDKLFKK